MRKWMTWALGALLASGAGAQTAADSCRLILRLDDAGMCAGVNQAVDSLLGAGLKASVSVLWPCPEWEGAAEVLKKYPEAAGGVHLAVNSEWGTYRWGPITGAGAVPSLVDSTGNFRAEFISGWINRIDTTQLKTELRSQIERATGSGARIDYVDGHMVWFSQSGVLTRIVKRLAAEYGLGVENTFGEVDVSGQYRESEDPAKALASLVSVVNGFKAGKTYKLYIHPGMNDSLMGTLRVAWDPASAAIGPSRHANRLALLAPEFKAALEAKKVKPITYRTLVEQARTGTPNRDPVPVPGGIRLESNYPNPFNPSTRIGYVLSEPSTVRLKVFDTAGHEVATLADGRRGRGEHAVTFDGGNLGSGVYLVRLEACGAVQCRKMMLVK